MAVQPPRLAWQASLPAWDDAQVAAEPSFDRLVRLQLDNDSWVDYCPSWLPAADELMHELAALPGWRQRERPMYDAIVTEPRLILGWSTEWDSERPDDEPKPPMPATIDRLRRLLSERYEVDFDSVLVNLYRDGSDSVAWHGDTVRKRLLHPLVAIVSLGEPRRFLLRPRGGRTARRLLLGAGDLLVMGGASQHDWEHAVPKVAAAGPRMSVTFRHSR